MFYSRFTDIPIPGLRRCELYVGEVLHPNGGTIVNGQDRGAELRATAATLWLVTVTGLCTGGGQIELVQPHHDWAIRLVDSKVIESRLLRHEHHSCLAIEIDASGPSEEEIRGMLGAAGLSIAGSRLLWDAASARRRVAFEIKQFRRAWDTRRGPFPVSFRINAALSGSSGETQFDAWPDLISAKKIASEGFTRFWWAMIST